MDYLGHSILELKSSGTDPATLAAIVTLQAEVAATERAILSIQNEAKSQQGEIKTAQDDIGRLKQNVVDLQSTLQREIDSLSAAIRVLQTAPSLGDGGCLVLTCPVATDTATLRVPISADWDSFYSTGYSPPGSPFTLNPFVSVNFQDAADPFGLYWNRPTAGANGATASFEIDASAAFIPSIDMAVRVGIKVMPDLFSTDPIFTFGYKEQRYRPSAFVSAWDARLIVRVPLTDGTLVANYIIFQVESRTLVAGDSQQFVYGIGESFSNQHHLIVKRIQ